MAFRLTQFLSILLTALALAPGIAHLAAMPNKIGLGQGDYFVVQQIYDGWALFGIVLFGALAANLAHAVKLMQGRQRSGWAIAATALVAANLVIFFMWTFPANQATGNWKIVPPNWAALRMQWEYSHAINALVMGAALVCAIIAVLRHRPPIR